MDATDRTPHRGRAALAGVLAAAVTLAVARLVAAVVDSRSDPLIAVGEGFIDRTPGWLKDAAIAAFGTADKLALQVGMLLVLAAAAVGIGLLGLRHRTAAVLAVLALGVVGAAAAVARPDAGPLASVPSLLGAAAGVVTLRALLDRLGTTAPPATTPSVPVAVARTSVAVEDRPAADAPPHGGSTPAGPGSPDPGRRTFLTGAAVAAAVALLAGAAGTVVGGARRVTDVAREALRLPAPARPAPAIPEDAQSPVDGVVPVLTPVPDFYRIDTALTVPQVDPDTWTLRIHGLVEREVVLTLDDVLAGDLVEAHVTLACVSNPVGGDLVGNGTWLGLPLAGLLAQAGPLPEADMVLSTSIDGWTASTPIEALTDGRDALLAVGHNGAPLTATHGFPARLVVPGLYGYVSATKWVTELELTRFDERRAYWTTRGWSERGPVKTASRIEVPQNRATVAAGRVAVGGTAWAQHRGITGVEVQVDEGEWQEAELSGEISVDTWRQWSWTWDARPGVHTLRVRASDPDGPQTGEPAPVVPDGATGWHEIEVTVR